jgi:hypothetical protein
VDKQPQHDKPAGHTVEVHLGALLVEASSRIVAEVEAAAEQRSSRALSLIHHPGDEELTRLTNALITDCKTLANGVREIPLGQRPPRAEAILQTWAELSRQGPEDGPLGRWSYTRYLARSARDMLRVIRYHRRTQQEPKATFVGREALPPVPASEQ